MSIVSLNRGVLIVFFGVGVLLGLAISLTGCVHYLATPLDADPAHARRFRKVQHGMVLAADLVHEPAVTRAYFFRPLHDRGIVPVVLHLENQGKRSILFRREAICMQLENGTRFSPLDPEEVIANCRVSSGWAYLGIPLVFPYVIAKPRIDQFNFDLDRDYRQKSLPPFLRIAPEDSPTARVIFFRLPDDALRALHRSPVIEVPAEVEALGEGKTHEPGENVQFHLSLN